VTGSILLVDDHVVIAQALAASLRAVGFGPVDYVRADALDVDGVLSAADALNPDVALVDLHLGEGRSGLPVIGPLVGRGIAVVAFTASEDPLAEAACLESGAAGFLPKSEAFEAVAAYVGRVAAGEDVVGVPRRAELLSALRAHRAATDSRLRLFASLTPREAEVLRALMAGRSAQEIADATFVAVKTVRTHIDSIHRKLGVRSQLAAVALAREVGWPGE
jgi:DNA-binding NarL/FixJ family response regulator